MNYSIKIKSSAVKDLKRVNSTDRQRIATTIDALSGQPHKGSLLKGDLRGLRRIRVGNYRIIYEVLDNELIVLVVRVSHRRDLYR